MDIIEMRKVIDGKSYNTSTAERVCCVSDGKQYLSDRDFYHEETDLYRTNSGSWFIAGHGGAASRWRTRLGDSWCAGKGIELLTEAEAKSMLEKFADAEVFEKYFEVTEG